MAVAVALIAPLQAIEVKVDKVAVVIVVMAMVSGSLVLTIPEVVEVEVDVAA